MESLANTHPELIKEWDYEKNSIKPEEITVENKGIIWWKCSKCGFSWKTSISNKLKSIECPNCFRREKK